VLLPVDTDWEPSRVTWVPEGTDCSFPAFAVGGPGIIRETRAVDVAEAGVIVGFVPGSALVAVGPKSCCTPRTTGVDVV
jgi:hypothetical protein